MVAHAMTMLAEEGEFPLNLGPVRRRDGSVAPGSPWRHHGGRAQVLVVLLETAGRHRMVDRHLQMFAGMLVIWH